MAFPLAGTTLNVTTRQFAPGAVSVLTLTRTWIGRATLFPAQTRAVTTAQVNPAPQPMARTLSRQVAASATLTGVGTLGPGGSVVSAALVPLNGAGTLTVGAGVTDAAVATLTAAGTIFGDAQAPPTSALTAAATLSAAGRASTSGTVLLSTTGVLATGALATQTGIATLAAASTLTPSGASTATGTGSLMGASTLVDTAAVTARAGATLTAVTSLSATAGSALAGSSSLTALATLAATGTAAAPGAGASATLTAGSTLTSFPDVAVQLAGTAVRADRTAAAATAEPIVPPVTPTSLAFTVLAVRPTGTSGGTARTPTAVATGRWQLEDPVTGDIYSFTINPTAADSPLPTRRITEVPTTAGQPISHEGSVEPVLWTLTGSLTAEAQLAELTAWARKPYRIWLSDDLGRTWVAYLRDWLPSPLRRPDRWQATYTLRVLLLEGPL